MHGKMKSKMLVIREIQETNIYHGFENSHALKIMRLNNKKRTWPGYIKRGIDNRWTIKVTEWQPGNHKGRVKRRPGGEMKVNDGVL